MRTDFCDYPSAWEIQNTVGPTLDHDPHCSSVPGWSVLSGAGFLCDCGAVLAYWKEHYSDGQSDA